jgi:glutamate N-acetyltransferase/amino-acid N-acetyltransferase
MEIIKGGVVAAKGFKTATACCGIKKSGKQDLALLVSSFPCVCAGAFTVNRVRSGSVILSEERVKKGTAQAIIVNSGNANCCVGKKEIKDAESITGLVSGKTGLGAENILIASTGIIGRPLPVGRILKGIDGLVNSLRDSIGTAFAKAIMTTDTVHKEIAVKIKINGKDIIIGGCAKGSGMICPNMATMLAFFTTDAAIEKTALKTAFKEAVRNSFNSITVDGDMSTNDSAFILANGAAKNKQIKKAAQDYIKFLAALKFVASELAKKIVLDGEGATRFIEVTVKGAKQQKDAETIARHIADSKLVKTMIAGGDPNWGRVAASAGSSGVKINKDKADIYFGKRLVMKNGAGMNVSEKPLLKMFGKKEIYVTVDLKSGRASSKIWTCDLTKRYIEINAEYET